MRSIAILGSTGSIGQNTLNVLESLGEGYRVVGLAVHSSIDLLEKQARQFRPRLVSVADPSAAETLRERLAGSPVQVLGGPDAALEVATMPEADLVIASIVGAAGLLPTLAAVEHGKDLAFVNKETLVVGGPLVMDAVRQNGVRLLPVDSEISAIFQCLQGNRRDSDIKRVLLTASGGPFRKTPLPHLIQVTVEQALRHPNWDMGAKITVDSATMMNKAFEVIEAKWLFDLSYEQIEVIIHPESIIHSMVEFVDGSLLAQLGVADMRVPIQYALTYPHRQASPSAPLDLIEIGSLHFETIEPGRYPCLEHAYRAMALGGTMPVVLNAVNEVAVEAFLQRQIPFLGIADLIGHVMQQHTVLDDPSLDQVLAVDQWARQVAHASIQAGR